MNLLSRKLKEGTKTAHTRAERSPFIRGFLRGQITRDQYTLLLGRLWYVYRALETQPAVPSPFFNAGHAAFLARTPAIEDDLEFFGASVPQSPSTAADRYAERIRHVVDHAPHLYVAHAYTRYLGDLSGGQALKRIVQKTFSLSTAAGASFYVFPQIPRIDAFKHAFRQQLDALVLTDAQHSEIVDEANVSFSLSRSIFDELEGLSGER